MKQLLLELLWSLAPLFAAVFADAAAEEVLAGVVSATDVMDVVAVNHIKHLVFSLLQRFPEPPKLQ